MFHLSWYQFHFMGISPSHILLCFLFKVDDININLRFNLRGAIKGLSDSQCGGGGLLQSQQPNNGGRALIKLIVSTFFASWNVQVQGV